MNSLPLFNRVVKTIAFVSLLFFGGVGLLIFSGSQKQDDKDRDYEKKLSASIQFVENFTTRKGRLPSEAEFGKRPSAQTGEVVDLITKDSVDSAFKSHGGTAKRDFCVRIWRGEQWTYYFSWNKKYDVVEP